MVGMLGDWAAAGRYGAVALGAAGALAFLVLAAVLTVIDAREHRLPRAWVLPAYPVLGILLGAAFALGEGPGSLLGGLLGAAGTGIFYGAVRLASPAAMGLGDVRLAPLLGWSLGLVSVPHALVGLLLSFLLAGLWAAGLILLRRADADSHVAFGPWMLLGTAAAWLALPARLL